MGRPGGCDCRCGGDSSDSSHTSSSASSSGSSISSDSSWSSSHGDGGCFDCCPVLPVEWSLWWPGYSRPPGWLPGWMLTCGFPTRTYLCPARGTYRLHFDPGPCQWNWYRGTGVFACWDWLLSIACVRDLVSPPEGVPPDATLIQLRSTPTCLGTLPGVIPLVGTWETILLPSSDPRRCAQQHTLNLVTEVQSMHCISPVPPFTDVIADYETPATIQIWPS